MMEGKKEDSYKMTISHNRSVSNNSNKVSIRFETKLDQDFINLFGNKWLIIKDVLFHHVLCKRKPVSSKLQSRLF